MAKSAVKTMPSAIVKRTVVMPVRPKNADVRTREYLTDDEVQRLAEAAKANRHALISRPSSCLLSPLRCRFSEMRRIWFFLATRFTTITSMNSHPNF